MITHEFEGTSISTDSYRLKISQRYDTIYRIDEPPKSRYTILTLQPGKYSFEESISQFGLEISAPSERRLRSRVVISVVPAPATLALLAPATLLTARRRRR